LGLELDKSLIKIVNGKVEAEPRRDLTVVAVADMVETGNSAKINDLEMGFVLKNSTDVCVVVKAEEKGDEEL